MAELEAGSLAADDGEYLDPGYDPQTPDGDNLLNDFGRAERALWASWGSAVDATVGHDDTSGATWVDAGSASVFGNPVIWTRPVDLDAATGLLDRIGAEFARRSGGAYLLYSVFPTPDLRPLGLEPVGHPPCMVRVPETPLAREVPEGLKVEPVTSAEQLDDFERVLVEAYPVSDLLPWRRGVFMHPKLLSDSRWHLFVGYADGEAVATAASYVTGQVVDVTLVTCRMEHRGRGFGRAVTQAAVDADPAKPALLIASDDGQPVYRSMGFRSLMRFTLWIGHRRLAD